MGTVGIVGMVVDLPLGLQQIGRALQFWTRRPDSRSKGRFGKCIFLGADTFRGLSVSDCEAHYRSSKTDISQHLCSGLPLHIVEVISKPNALAVGAIERGL